LRGLKIADLYNDIGVFVEKNWPILGIVILALVGIVIFFRPQKKQLKPVKRSEIERKEFIRRMKLNDSPFETLRQNDKNKYRILKFQASTKAEMPVYELVVKTLIGGILPYGDEIPMILSKDSVDYDLAEPKFLVLKNGSTLWYRMGIFVDNRLGDELIKYFVREYTVQTDWEDLSSIYYAKSQEQAVIDAERAHKTLSDHLEIERIKEERKKLQLGA
jgi:hypothetical protein